MEARIRDNRIVLPIGTVIGFKMIGKNYQKVDLKVTESQEDSKFYTLFDENDVDFEIEINNSKCIHGIGYTLIVNNGFYDYYIGPQEVWSMEALYTRGRKLHFISEKSEEGQQVIQKTAEEYDMSYSESAAVCSRIEFNFEVEKAVPKPPISEIDTKSQRKGMFSSLSSKLLMRRNSRDSDIPEILGVTSARGMSSSTTSSDVADAYDCESYDASAIPAVPTMSAMSTKSTMFTQRYARRSCNRISSAQPLTDCLTLERQSLAKPFIEAELNVPKEEPKSEPNEIGDKGVVCFGEESNQLYNPYGGFTKDKDMIIKSFVVELRFSKK